MPRLAQQDRDALSSSWSNPTLHSPEKVPVNGVIVTAELLRCISVKKGDKCIFARERVRSGRGLVAAPDQLREVAHALERVVAHPAAISRCCGSERIAETVIRRPTGGTPVGVVQ